MTYYPLQDRIRHSDAPLELVAVFYELLDPDTCWQPEFYDYRTALHRERDRMTRELVASRKHNNQL